MRWGEVHIGDGVERLQPSRSVVAVQQRSGQSDSLDVRLLECRERDDGCAHNPSRGDSHASVGHLDDLGAVSFDAYRVVHLRRQQHLVLHAVQVGRDPAQFTGADQSLQALHLGRVGADELAVPVDLAPHALNLGEVADEHSVHVSLGGAVQRHQRQRQVAPAERALFDVPAVAGPCAFHDHHGVKVIIVLVVVDVVVVNLHLADHGHQLKAHRAGERADLGAGSVSRLGVFRSLLDRSAVRLGVLLVCVIGDAGVEVFIPSKRHERIVAHAPGRWDRLNVDRTEPAPPRPGEGDRRLAHVLARRFVVSDL